MKLALCYESVLPSRGGCETYIADLAQRLAADRHEVHLFASEWDAERLPEDLHYHRLPAGYGPRWLRPWRFAAACARAVRDFEPIVSIGFNKTWGQDVQYPLGGLHVASAEHNLRKYRHPLVRGLARLLKGIDPAHWSFTLLERRQYLAHRPLVVVISGMVRDHFRFCYGIDPDDLRLVPCAIDPGRFAQPDRPRRRLEWRRQWDIRPDDTVALFVAMNYRLKGLEPLLHAVARLKSRERFRLLVAGHPHTSGWQRLAGQLGIADCVRFLGPRKDVHHCFFAADFLVHPTFYDPCSLVVLEALACGLPVITSRYNGAAELLHPPREGYVIDDPHDHQHLAWSIEQLLEPGWRQACAQAARRTAHQWTFDQHYRLLLEVFEEAYERKQAA
jgi:UDP-glucose:(heptosyl)LPS alpha-1,3-glucosyltransferase